MGDLTTLTALLVFSVICIGGGIGVMERAARWSGWVGWYLAVVGVLCTGSGVTFLWWFLRHGWGMFSG
jgi:hypothetical protein